jgi:hypothetical protein
MHSNDDQESLIERAASQPLLFPADEVDRDYIGDPRRNGAYTAEEVFAQRPEIYREVVRLLACNTSINAIRRICKVHAYTVQAIATREGQSIETLRLSMGKRMLQTASLMVEAVEEAVLSGKLQPKEMPFAISVLADKGQLLTAGATARIETRTAPEKSSFEAWLDEAKPANAVLIDGAEKMGSPAREQIALAKPDRAACDLGPDGCAEAINDIQSTVCNDSNRVNAEIDTTYDTAPPVNDAGSGDGDQPAQGGEGVADSTGGSQYKDRLGEPQL